MSLKSQKKNQILIMPSRGRPKRVTNGKDHLRGLAPGKHSSEETLQQWRAFSDTESDLTDLPHLWHRQRCVLQPS